MKTKMEEKIWEFEKEFAKLVVCAIDEDHLKFTIDFESKIKNWLRSALTEVAESAKKNDCKIPEHSNEKMWCFRCAMETIKEEQAEARAEERRRVREEIEKRIAYAKAKCREEEHEPAEADCEYRGEAFGLLILLAHLQENKKR